MSIITENTKQYNRIRGLSGIRRLPRLGKIRLGIKKISKNGKEYPAEVEYFVCPPEVQKIYGPKPISLDVMFPVDSPEIVFPQAYKWYTSSSLKCKGDGESAMRRFSDLTDDQKKSLNGETPKDPNFLVEIECPCPLLESGMCSQKGNLLVLLHRVSMGGVYQIDTGSFHNIVRINSAFDYIRGLLGRIALVPLVLRRMEESIEYENKRTKHYLMSLEFAGNLAEVKQLRENTSMVLTQVSTLALPAPTEEPNEVPSLPEKKEEPQPATQTSSVETPEYLGEDVECFTSKIELVRQVKKGNSVYFWIDLEEGEKIFTSELNLAVDAKAHCIKKSMLSFQVSKKVDGTKELILMQPVQ